MKPLDHALHILDKNNIILVPVFFQSALSLTIISYVINLIGPYMTPEELLQNIDIIAPKFFWLFAITSGLLLFIEAFFTSMTLTMVFEAWKKGKTKLNLGYGSVYFFKLLFARILFLIPALSFSGLLLIFLTTGAVLPAIFFGAIAILFAFSFFWINETIVTKGASPISAFFTSLHTTITNPRFTFFTASLVFAIYIVAQSTVNIFSIANIVFLTTLVGLVATIISKTIISILKIVSFLQTK